MKKLKEFLNGLVPQTKLYNVKIAYWTKDQSLKYEYMSFSSKEKGNKLKSEALDMFEDEWCKTDLKENEDMSNLQSFQSIEITEVKVTM